MIVYGHERKHIVLSIFQRRGSVFLPSLLIAFPCAVFTATINFCNYYEYWSEGFREGLAFLSDNNAWSGFSGLVGFLIVFRTSQAYSRFWEGCTAAHKMRAEWFDACSSIMAFTRHSTADRHTIFMFKHLLIRMFSLMHALALMEIEDDNVEYEANESDFSYDLIDIESVDQESLETVKASTAKVELVFQWIQQTVVENILTGVLSIPPPILSRSFQELSNGMVEYHEALKISTIPFPFPYAQTCNLLLILHWIGSPFVMSQWVADPWCCFALTFIQIFIFWALNFISLELENPFGSDDNDMDTPGMQEEMNRHLVLLVNGGTTRLPYLVGKDYSVTSMGLASPFRGSEDTEDDPSFGLSAGLDVASGSGTIKPWDDIGGVIKRNYRASRQISTTKRTTVTTRNPRQSVASMASERLAAGRGSNFSGFPLGLRGSSLSASSASRAGVGPGASEGSLASVPEPPGPSALHLALARAADARAPGAVHKEEDTSADSGTDDPRPRRKKEAAEAPSAGPGAGARSPPRKKDAADEHSQSSGADARSPRRKKDTLPVMREDPSIVEFSAAGDDDGIARDLTSPGIHGVTKISC